VLYLTLDDKRKEEKFLRQRESLVKEDLGEQMSIRENKKTKNDKR
jgi:hypothetical protein